MLSLALITKKPNKNLDRLLYVMSDYVDEICIGVQEDKPKDSGKVKWFDQPKEAFVPITKDDKEFFESFGVTTNDEQVFRFDVARNDIFSKCTGDWILWLDDDDIIDKPEEIAPLLAKVAPEVNAVMVNYAYLLDANGNSLMDHWKTRIIRRGSDFTWKGRIHEDLLGTTPVAKTHDFQVLHLQDKATRDNRTNRNLIALLKEYHDNFVKPDPRILMYLGLTLFDHNQIDLGVQTLMNFIKLSEWDEQRYDAWVWIGKKTGNIDAYFEAIKERPDYPMAYFEIAQWYLDNKKYKKANEFYKMGFSKGKPDTALGINPRSLDLIPLFNQAEVLYHLGDVKTAIKNVEKCLEFYPDDIDLLEKMAFYKGIQADADEVKRILKDMSKHRHQKGLLQKDIESIPEHLQGDPVLAKAINSLITRKWDKDEIVIFAPSFIEPWSPDSLATGIGGSEEAIIRLSRELRDKGMKVTVYANTVRGNYDGVIYRNMEEFNHNDEFNLLVLWRCPYELDNKFNAKQVWLWLHDVHEPEDFTDYRIKNVNKVIVLSKYHRSLFPMIPEEKILYSANGLTIDYNLYKKVVRDPYKMIYTSCPSRGLEHLLDWWPEIKRAVPKANLHVFYGFKNFEYAHKENPEMMAWAEKMKEKLNQDGITFYGRTGQDEINQHTAEAGVWAYPTEFPEISCITAMKCQALGAYCISTGYAALAETQKYGDKVEIANFKERLIAILKADISDSYRQEMMDWARKEFSWKKVAEEWIDATRTT